jgi:DHA2 family multidrug resistance protein-like MFS transporter
LLAALLSIGAGSNRVPALVAAGLAVIAGICSFARLKSASNALSAEEDR